MPDNAMCAWAGIHTMDNRFLQERLCLQRSSTHTHLKIITAHEVVPLSGILRCCLWKAQGFRGKNEGYVSK